MKYLFLVSVIIFIAGCKSENYQNDNKILMKENDSLKNILKELSNKYIFDSISFRDIYSKNNTNKLNSKFEIELLVIGFNSNQSFFVKYDSISSEGGLINPDTLKQLYGGFKVETVLRNKKNPIRVDMNINSPYGKSKKGRLYDEIIID
jgi:hypothetical protein